MSFPLRWVAIANVGEMLTESVVQFLALYQWHSNISAVDEQWTEEIFTSPQMFGNKPYDEVGRRQAADLEVH